MNYIKKKYNSINILLVIFSFILIFEILFRAMFSGTDILFNFIKVFFSIIFILYIILIKKELLLKYKMFNYLWIMFLFILLIKTFRQGTFFFVIEWFKSNNNINYIFIYIYFFIFVQLKEEININIIIKWLKFICIIVIILSILLFLSNNYLGMVSYENMLAYAWVGTNYTRMMSIFGNPNQAGLYFVMMLLINDYKNIVEEKKFFDLFNICVIICNLLTFSRTSIVIMIIYIITRSYLSISEKKLKKIKIWLKKYILFLIFIIIFIVVYIIINKYNLYFFKKEYLFESSRWKRWEIGILYMSIYPILGTPFGIEPVNNTLRYGLLAFSDNMFLEIGVRFGLVLFLSTFLYLIYCIYRCIKTKDFFYYTKLQVLIISGLLSGTIHFSVFIYLCMFYCVLIGNIKRRI